MTENKNDEEYVEEVVIERREIQITEEATENLPTRRNIGTCLGVLGLGLSGASTYLGVDALLTHEGKKQLNSFLSSSLDYLSSELSAETESALKQYEMGNEVAGKKSFETIDQKLLDMYGNLEQQQTYALEQGVDLHSIMLSTAIAENVVKNTAQ